MEPLHLAHLISLGVVITEVLFEFAGSDPESRRAAARFHTDVDKYGVPPILIGVLVTGHVPWGVAIDAAARHQDCGILGRSELGPDVCVRWVLRGRQIEDVNVLVAYCRRISMLGAIAAVFATPALYLGLVSFGGNCSHGA